MKSQSRQLPGLHIYRALAVILMMLAHSARTQSNIADLRADPAQAGLFDWLFVGTLQIEPIISALFLFIAGFSLVLSLQQSRESAAVWLTRLGRRMATLYGISVLFALAEQGVQWPATLVSSGVLGIIAVGVFAAGCLLVSARPWLGLLLATLAVTAITWFLEQERLHIIGLNAGAGGMLPLVSLAWVGALCGLVYQRWQLNGLALLFAFSLPVALLALLAAAPWIIEPANTIRVYPGSDPLQTLGHSLLDLVGAYDGPVRAVQVHYWNHGWIFALRALPVLLLGLLVFLGSVTQVRHPVGTFLQWMGRQALNLYILHLVVLGILVVAGVHPASGWQTLLLVAGMIALAPLLLRYLSFVPLRIGAARQGANAS